MRYNPNDPIIDVVPTEDLGGKYTESVTLFPVEKNATPRFDEIRLPQKSPKSGSILAVRSYKVESL